MSVNMVAELALWIPDTTERQEDYSAVAKDATATAVALDTKARAAKRNSCSTEERTRPISTVQDRSQGLKWILSCWLPWSHRAISEPTPWWTETRTTYRRESLDRLSMTLQSQKAAYSTGRGSADHRHHRLGDDGENSRWRVQQPLKTQRKIAWFCQTKVVDFEIYNKSLSEELEVLAKAKDVISERTDDSEYRGQPVNAVIERRFC